MLGPSTSGGGGLAAPANQEAQRGFTALPATREEASAIAETFDKAFEDVAPRELLLRRVASRERLEEIASLRPLPPHRHPRLVRAGVGRVHRRPAAARCPRWPQAAHVGAGARPWHEPDAVCGIAFSGANLPVGEVGRIPGLMTAEEIATLDLSNCELAVLSACDTNVGIRRAGQGVASLQRALHMAGARSVITSLWKVPDEATKELMADFDRRLWIEKKPKEQALWEAKRELRSAKDELGRPRYSERDWAGWVLTGASD